MHHYYDGSDYLNGQGPAPVDGYVDGSDYLTGKGPAPVDGYVDGSDYLNGKGPAPVDSYVDGSDYLNGKGPAPVDGYVDGSDYLNGKGPAPVDGYVDGSDYLNGKGPAPMDGYVDGSDYLNGKGPAPVDGYVDGSDYLNGKGPAPMDGYVNTWKAVALPRWTAFLMEPCNLQWPHLFIKWQSCQMGTLRSRGMTFSIRPASTLEVGVDASAARIGCVERIFTCMACKDSVEHVPSLISTTNLQVQSADCCKSHVVHILRWVFFYSCVWNLITYSWKHDAKHKQKAGPTCKMWFIDVYCCFCLG